MTTDLLHTLLAVQELDTRADQLRHRRASLPERAQRDQLAALVESLGATAREVGAARSVFATEQEQLESFVAEGERKRASLETKSRSTFVPRDAQAISDELNAIATRQAHLEDRILELMEEIEPLDAQLADLAAREETARADLAAATAALAEAQAAVDAELSGTVEERAGLASGVPAALMERYEKLRARMGGVAVARLEGSRCLGCHLELPRGELEEVRREPPDALVTCPQCARLLVR
jgi:uncharacterized protein